MVEITFNDMVAKARRMPKWVNVAIPVIGTCVMLALVFNMVNWVEFYHAIEKMDSLSIAIALGALLASISLQGVKLWVFLRGPSMSRVVRASMSSYLFFMMPMGTVLGPAVLLRMLNGYINAFRTGSAMVVDIVTKFLTLFLTLLLGLCLATIRDWSVLIAPVAVIISLTVLLLAIMSHSGTRKWIVGKLKFLKRYSWGDIVIKLADNLAIASETLRERPLDILAHLVLGVASELMYVAPFVVLGAQLGVGIQAIDWVWIGCMVRILSSVPLTIGGIGVREGALMLILTGLSVPSGTILTLSLIYTSLNVVSALLCSLLLIGSKKPKIKLPKTRNLK